MALPCAMDPVAVFDPDDGSSWLQTGDAVTITLPVEEKPLVAIHSKHIEIRAADGERSPILQKELAAQVAQRSGWVDVFKMIVFF